VREVAKAGGTAEKFISAGRRDVPDRIVTWISPLLDFVELKAPGEKPTPGQLRDHARRRARGYSVLVIDSKEGVDLYVKARALQARDSYAKLTRARFGRSTARLTH
jgi:hypothetical protein